MLPVRIWGVDRGGRAFSKAATTLVVSVNGSRLDGVRVPLLPGDVVGVQYGNRKSRFRVIWVGAAENLREGQVGFCCLDRDKRLFGRESAEVEKLAAGQAAADRALPAQEPKGEHGEERRHGERRREERRMHPRYKCGAGVEVRKQGVDGRVWGTVGDLSLGGCYVEMMTPFPAETLVELELTLGERRLKAGGVVRIAHAGCGMGVQFTEMSGESRAQLQQIVNCVAQVEARPIEPPRPDSPPAPLPARSEGSTSYSSRVLQGVLAFFGERDTLARREFQEILQRAKQAGETRDKGVH